MNAMKAKEKEMKDEKEEERQVRRDVPYISGYGAERILSAANTGDQG